jgi:hypothetical protein
VVLNGEATFFNAVTPPTNYALWFQVDGACSVTGMLQPANGRLEDSLDQNTTSDVATDGPTPGSHTYRLCATIGTGGDLNHILLVAQAVG